MYGDSLALELRLKRIGRMQDGNLEAADTLLEFSGQVYQRPLRPARTERLDYYEDTLVS
jgi:hypothetical protein